MKTNTKKFSHFSCKTYLFGMFQQARVVYASEVAAQTEVQPVEGKKLETPGKTPDEKIAKLGKDADDLKADIDHLKANANPKIKELVANAEARLARLDVKDRAGDLTENEKTAFLDEVQGILVEAEQRAVYEQQKDETIVLGKAAKKGVDLSLQNPLAGLNVSKEAGAAINDLAINAAFKQKVMIETLLGSAIALTLDSDKGGQKLQLIKDKLSGADPGFKADLAKVYNEFVAKRDVAAKGVKGNAINYTPAEAPNGAPVEVAAAPAPIAEVPAITPIAEETKPLT